MAKSASAVIISSKHHSLPLENPVFWILFQGGDTLAHIVLPWLQQTTRQVAAVATGSRGKAVEAKQLWSEVLGVMIDLLTFEISLASELPQNSQDCLVSFIATLARHLPKALLEEAEERRSVKSAESHGGSGLSLLLASDHISPSVTMKNPPTPGSSDNRPVPLGLWDQAMLRDMAWSMLSLRGDASEKKHLEEAHALACEIIQIIDGGCWPDSITMPAVQSLNPFLSLSILSSSN